jgi:hypothetical protein
MVGARASYHLWLICMGYLISRVTAFRELSLKQN